LNKVTYSEASVHGLALPQEVAVGAALHPSGKLVIALDIDWLNWSRAMQTSTLTASHPDTAGAPAVIESAAALQWHNQTVYALGIAYELNESVTLRGGYNYGKNPIPPQNLSPLLSAIGEKEITAGLGYRSPSGWRIDTALEWQLTNSVTYANPALPLGTSSKETNGFISFHVTLARRW
jgi:long-chain fatty acid transport protein